MARVKVAMPCMYEVDDLTAKFRLLDKNGDGTLNFPELRGFFLRMNCGFTERECRILFDAVDHDRSGKVGLSEFLEFVFAPDSLVRSSVPQVVSAESTLALPHAVSALTQDLLTAFKRLDLDHDGTLGLDELQEMIKGDCPGEYEVSVREVDVTSMALAGSRILATLRKGAVVQIRDVVQYEDRRVKWVRGLSADADGWVTLSRNDARSMTKRKSFLSQEELEALFNCVERDGDERIGITEFVRFISHGDHARVALELVTATEERNAQVLTAAMKAARQAGLVGTAMNRAERTLDELMLRRYIERDSLLEALEDGSVVLIRGSWLADLSDGNGVMPRRQDLPRGACWAPFEAAATEPTILAVSYCWLTPEHPDPGGEQLRTLAHALRLLMVKEGDVAVFLDWCSMHQRPRTNEESAAFSRSLRSVNLWYAHQRTLVWSLTAVPPGWGSRSLHYDLRGWPCFERAIANLISAGDAVLDLGCLRKRSSYLSMRQECVTSRAPPVAPDDFVEELRKKRFTNGADFELVAVKYRETFAAVMGGAQELSFSCCSWGDQEIEIAARALPFCRRLRSLDLHSNNIGEKGALALAQALKFCHDLNTLDLQTNKLGNSSVDALGLLIRGCQKLRQLRLHQNEFDVVGKSRIKSRWTLADKAQAGLWV